MPRNNESSDPLIEEQLASLPTLSLSEGSKFLLEIKSGKELIGFWLSQTPTADEVDAFYKVLHSEAPTFRYKSNQVLILKGGISSAASDSGSSRFDPASKPWETPHSVYRYALGQAQNFLHFHHPNADLYQCPSPGDAAFHASSTYKGQQLFVGVQTGIYQMLEPGKFSRGYDEYPFFRDRMDPGWQTPDILFREYDKSSESFPGTREERVLRFFHKYGAIMEFTSWENPNMPALINRIYTGK